MGSAILEVTKTIEMDGKLEIFKFMVNCSRKGVGIRLTSYKLKLKDQKLKTWTELGDSDASVIRDSIVIPIKVKKSVIDKITNVIFFE